MKRTVLLLALGALLFFAKRVLGGEIVAPDEAAKRVVAGAAILVDVREPDEWTGGVVEGALLLPLSDLRGARELWRPILEAHRDKELILYCRSGNRSGVAAGILSAEGFRVSNAGGFAAWRDAGQATRKP